MKIHFNLSKWQKLTRWIFDPYIEDKVYYTVDLLFHGTGDGTKAYYVFLWLTPNGSNYTYCRKLNLSFNTINESNKYAEKLMKKIFN